VVSLREAIAAANSGDIIAFEEALGGQSIRLTSALTIGAGENFTIQGDVDRDGRADITIDGQNATRLMNVQVGATVALDTIILANGNDVGSTGAAGGTGGNGVAGILNEGALTLTHVLFSGNTATGGTGGDGGNGVAGAPGSSGGFGNGGPGGSGGSAGNGGAGGLAASAVFNSAGAQLTLIDSAWVDQTINYGQGGKGGNGGPGGVGGIGGEFGSGGNGGAGGAGGDEGAQGAGGAIVNLGNMTVSGAVAGFGSTIIVGAGRGAGLGGAGGAGGTGGIRPGSPGANGSAGDEAPTPVQQPELLNLGTLTGFSVLSTSLAYLAAPTLSQAEGTGGAVTNYTFTVVRLGDISAAAAVAFSITGGTADALDFSGGVTSGTASLIAGKNATAFTIGVVQDQVIEADETYTASISSNTSGLDIGARSSLTAAIINDDVREIFTVLTKKPVTIIDDFDTRVDLIQLEDRVFKNLLGNGPLKKKSFTANGDGEATKAVAQIIYDTDSGRLLYDRDGTGNKNAVHFATLEGSPNLSRFDFDLI
jgi:hypothetical protein